jgi:putative membrane protein
LNTPDGDDRRTQLAADRTILAAERTYGSWIRTGLTALASGVGAKALLGDLMPDWAIRGTGAMLAFFSAFCFVAAAWRVLHLGPPPPQTNLTRVPASMLVVVNTVLTVVALIALISILFAPTPGVPQAQ